MAEVRHDGSRDFSALKKTFRVWCEFDLRCNIDCFFCYNHCRDGKTGSSPVASTATILDSLTRLFRLPVSGVALSGGEITVRGDLESIIEHCANASMPTTVVSNGVLLTAKRVAALVKKGPVAFQVTLHGSTPEIHDAITRRTIWKTVLANLLSMRDNGIPLTLAFVACPQNIQDFVNVMEIAALLNCSEVIFNHALTTTGAGHLNRHSLACDEDSVVNSLTDASAFARQHAINIRLGTPYLFNRQRIDQLPNLSGGRPRDRTNLDQVTMDPFGNIRACSLSSINIGNVNAPTELMTAMRSEPKQSEIRTGECVCLNMRSLPGHRNGY